MRTASHAMCLSTHASTKRQGGYMNGCALMLGSGRSNTLQLVVVDLNCWFLLECSVWIQLFSPTVIFSRGKNVGSQWLVSSVWWKNQNVRFTVFSHCINVFGFMWVHFTEERLANLAIRFSLSLCMDHSAMKEANLPPTERLSSCSAKLYRPFLAAPYRLKITPKRSSTPFFTMLHKCCKISNENPLYDRFWRHRCRNTLNRKVEN